MRRWEQEEAEHTCHSRHFDFESEMVHFAIRPVKEMTGMPSRAFESAGEAVVLAEMVLSVLLPLLETPSPASV